MRKLINELSGLRGISGSEYRITDKIADLFKPYADEIRRDALGSVIAVKRCGIKDAPRIMIEAHCDEIGLMVTGITDEGCVRFANIGGIDERILPSMEVVIHGRKDIPGIIGIKSADIFDKDKTAPIKELAADTGMSADRLRELVSVGDSITIAQSVGALGKKQWSGKSLDDRAGIAALITVMKKLKGHSLSADVYAVAAVQEEVGCRGAKTAAHAIKPDAAIAVDVTHAVTPDNSDNAFETGCGAVIAAGPNLHPGLTRQLMHTAGHYGIKTELEAEGGDTGTDAWEIQVANGAIPTALLSIPLKYMHTAVETLTISDVKSVARLMYHYILDQGGRIALEEKTV